jgi:tetratricopeptide (TPR) repeat protein
VTNTSPDATPEQEQSRARHRRYELLVLLLVVATGGGLFVALPLLETAAMHVAARVLLILVGTFLPATMYFAFVRGRLPTLLAEYKQNLRRLGFPENAQQYQNKFDVTYGRNPDTPQSLLVYAPLLVATLLSAVGWLLVLVPPPGGLADLAPNATPLAYGFLGAYVFSIGSLVRQYVTDDLQLRYYASMFSRFLVVFVLAWLIPLLIPGGNESHLIAAFAFGLFPTIGLTVIQRLATSILGIPFKGFREAHPLSALDGLNAYAEDRLLLEGIENLQNLACAKVVDLMLKTRYPIEQIVDWIDQSLLHIHARERIEDFQRAGLRTATDFLDDYSPPGLAGESLATRRLNLARLLDGDRNGAADEARVARTLSQLESIAAALRLAPNLFHIRYWRDHEYEALPEDVERSRTNADLKLMQGLPDEAIVAYGEVLRSFPNHHTALLYRGMASFAIGQFDGAIDDYTAAIDHGGVRWEGARHAYVERGRAWRELGQYDRAAEDYRQAIELFDDFPEAHFELAYVQLMELRLYDEAIEHFEFAARAKFRPAQSLANLGLARHERWKQRGRLPETAAAELGQAQSDLDRARRLRPDLIVADLNLANVYDDLGQPAEAERVLADALRKLETVDDRVSAYRARLHRGNLYSQQANYQAAADDYRAASALLPDDAAAYFNLGVTLRALDDLDAAKDAFAEATRLNRRHIPAHQALGDTELARARFPEAETAYTRALALTRETGDRHGEAVAHLSLGRLYRAQPERGEDAGREVRQALALSEAVADELLYTRATYELALVDLDAGHLDDAVKHFATSAELFDILSDARASAAANLNLGRAYRARDEPTPAAEALTKARRQLATVFRPLDEDDDRLQQEIALELAAVAAAIPAPNAEGAPLPNTEAAPV